MPDFDLVVMGWPRWTSCGGDRWRGAIEEERADEFIVEVNVKEKSDYGMRGKNY